MNNKSPIEFTNQPVEIVGRLEVDPKVDEFNYTTQFRIYAKKVTELKNFNFDKEAMSYFQQMNRDNIIAALQIAFVNINQSLYPEILNDSSLSTNKKYSIIKEKLNLGFISKGAQVMKKNLNHIETIKPSNTSVMKIHNDLIALFAETVALLEDIDKLNIEMSSTKYSSDEEKEKLLTTLYNLYERNKDCFEKFTLWNDSIR